MEDKLTLLTLINFKPLLLCPRPPLTHSLTHTHAHTREVAETVGSSCLTALFAYAKGVSLICKMNKVHVVVMKPLAELTLELQQ